MLLTLPAIKTKIKNWQLRSGVTIKRFNSEMISFGKDREEIISNG